MAASSGRRGRSGPGGVAVVLTIAAVLVGWVWLAESHVAWVDGLPGTGAAYAAGVLAVAQLPTLLLAAAYVGWRATGGSRSVPTWWQWAAALVGFWHVTLVIATVDRKDGRMGVMERGMDPERFDVASTTLRVSCLVFLLAVLVVATRGGGRRAGSGVSKSRRD